MNYASMGEERRVMLHRARESFQRIGVVPADVAARLMALGVIVPDLERMWSTER